jgi:predicted transcriptional regulator
MTKYVEQGKARQLRASGRSVRSIARELHVSQGSVSVWVRGIAPAPAMRAASAEDRPPSRPLPVWTSAATRRCARCALTLPLEVYGTTARGRQGWCRACFREYARDRGQAHSEQVRASKVQRRAAGRAWVLEYLADHPCADCGTGDPVVLEFDHIGPKSGDVGTMIANGCRLERIQAEIARCEVVCANCHRRRTARRSAWLRASPAWRLALGTRTGAPARNKLFAYDYLVNTGCIDCGSKDLVVLDFDHVRDKRANIAKLSHCGYSLATVAAEVAKCEVRCANCHRRKTSERGGHYRSLVDGRGNAPWALELAPDRRGRARSLRAEGLTIAEIAAEVGAAASTVGAWLRDMPLDNEQRAAMHARRRELRVAAAARDAAAEMRICKTCGVSQLLAQFSRNGAARRWQCKACDAARNRSRTAAHRLRAATAQRERRAVARERRSGNDAVA